MKREKEIIKVSLIGILVNIILVIFKSIIGIITNSIAIILDAINNLSDVLSSIITIIGTKIANKAPDKKHPYGHGRIEYISTIIITIIIFIAGLDALKESVLKVLNPTTAHYPTVSLIIITVTIIVKIILGNYVTRKGIKNNSTTLIVSGKDALFDSIISLSTLIAALISIYFKISIEGYIGVIISLLIIKTSVFLLKDTLSSIIGERIDMNISKEVIKIVESYDEVEGAYDLILHSYGPNMMIGSIHIQVDDNMKASKIHSLSKRIETKIYEKLGIILTIGIYANNSSDSFSLKVKENIEKIIKNYNEVLELHGLYVYDKNITFDLIISFDAENREKKKKKIIKKLKKEYKDYIIYCNIDSDYTDR